MLIDSIIIELTKGGGIGPEYSLKIFGNGKVVYDGVGNVKVKGIVESSIDKNKFLSLLSEFKEADFFQLNDIYFIKDSITKPHTIISISIPKEEGKIATKSIKYYHEDKNVPEKLKNLENKIDEIVGSEKWVKIPPKQNIETPREPQIIPQKEVKKTSGRPRKISSKLIAGVIGIVVIIAVVVVMINLGFFPSSESSKKSVEYDPPRITSVTTFSETIGGMPTDELDIFEQGDPIYVFYDYSNVTHNGTYNVIEDVRILLSGLEIDSYHAEIVDTVDFEPISNYCTFYTNESWNVGEYQIYFDLTDNVSGKSISYQANFTLYEQIPKIITFTPASAVRGYQDYDLDVLFDVNDTVYVYAEYAGINTTLSNTQCNINLNLVIFDSYGDEYASKKDNKTEVKNNAHYWWFWTNESSDKGIWDAGFYTLQLDLLDYTTGLSTQDNTYFILS